MSLGIVTIPVPKDNAPDHPYHAEDGEAESPPEPSDKQRRHARRDGCSYPSTHPHHTVSSSTIIRVKPARKNTSQRRKCAGFRSTKSESHSKQSSVPQDDTSESGEDGPAGHTTSEHPSL